MRLVCIAGYFLNFSFKIINGITEMLQIEDPQMPVMIVLSVPPTTAIMELVKSGNVMKGQTDMIISSLIIKSEYLPPMPSCLVEWWGGQTEQIIID